MPGEVTTLPGEVTTLPGVITTITEDGSVTTLPGQVTTLPGETVTLPGEVTTLPGDTVTLPGEATTLPGETVTLPGDITTLPGSLTTLTESGTIITTTLDGSLTTITQEASTFTEIVPTTLPGSIITSVVTTSLPGLSITVTEAGTTVISTQPGSTSTFTTTFSVPAVTITAPGSTVTITEAFVCPMPTNTPGVPVTPQNTGPNAVWGCSPGYVCDPPKPAGCNIWANPPNADYLCDAKNCIPSPNFNPVEWPENTTTWYPPTKGYFNLNPRAFGLDYTIFVKRIITTTITKHHHTFVATLTTGDWASKASLSHFATSAPPVSKRAIIQKRDQTIVPAVCFADCNNCFIEAQRVGKSDALCDPDSAFQESLATCEDCVATSGDPTKLTLQNYVEPQFAQFIDFCSVQAPQPVVEPSTSTVSVIPVPATKSVVVETQTQATPTISASVTSQVQAPVNTNTAPSPIGPSTPTPTTEEPTGPSATSEVPSATSTADDVEFTPSASGSGGSVPSGTTSGGSTSTTDGPIQVTGASNNLQPSSFFILATILLLSLLAI